VQNLGYEVVVEGIEHEALQQFLLQHQCEYSQGYLFSKPQNFTSLLEYLVELSPQVRASGE
jgi:EAL domain-containing protein (putative c-di-GMP-specific phosphodiesterase class I)